jgi:hypothetical protein
VRFAVKEGGEIVSTSYESPYTRTIVTDLDMWWTKQQRKLFKGEAWEEAMHAKQCLGEEYVKTFLRVYKRFSSGKSLSDALKESFQKSLAGQDALRGIEIYVLDEMRQYRVRRIERVVESVLYVQTKCSLEGTPPQVTGEMIRCAVESVSREGEALAYEFGQADQLAARNNDTKVVDILPNHIHKKHAEPKLLRQSCVALTPAMNNKRETSVVLVA